MTKMTRKDFQFIAKCVSERQPLDETGEEYNVWMESVEFWVSSLKRTNPQFNPDRFRRACGVPLQCV